MNKEELRFHPDAGVLKEKMIDGKTISYYEWKDLPYCLNPADPIQTVNVFVPKAYVEGKSIGPYDRHTAPIFIPNTVGGYLPGPADEPGYDRFKRVNSVFEALHHGYVVVSPGVRGRTSGKKSDEFFEGSVVKNGKTGDKACGKAPAFITDLKAAIRWLRFNDDAIFGDTERMITSGTSAGGALSALAGMTGNCQEYEPYLEAIGALPGRDDVFAASCYCPIIDLDHADMAYEWQFGNEKNWTRTRRRKTEEGLVREVISGTLSPEEELLSQQLSSLYPSYINQFSLKDEKGNSLYLQEDGTGSFQNWIIEQLIASARQERETKHYASTCGSQVVEGSFPEGKEWLKDGLDWNQYIHAITRMKAVPAFDALDGKSPENEEFGTESIPARHFTDFSTAHATDQASKADDETIRLMNPLAFTKNEGKAKHWRIRHGAYDRDTSLAVPALFNLLLQAEGVQPDFAYPWGLPHAGDYDLPELFEWIDEAVKEEEQRAV